MSNLVNEFSFSFSSWKTYRECPRRWWLSKVLSWEGWDRDAEPSKRLAYALGKMQDFYGLAGGIVHEIARDFYRLGMKLDAGQLAASFRDRFARAVEQSESGAWSRDPKRHANIFEHYYSAPGAGETEERARDFGLTAVHNLPTSPATERARRGAVLQTEMLERFEVSGVPVWVQIDLASRVDGVIWLEDHKTGASRPEHRDQGMLYALFAHDVRKVPLERLRVGLGYLRDGSEDVIAPWSAGELDELRAVIAVRAETIKDSLDRPARGAWLNAAPAEAFPETTDAETCARCHLFHVCKGAREIPWSGRTMAVAATG